MGWKNLIKSCEKISLAMHDINELKAAERAQHIERHKLLHEHLDELLADFIAHTKALPSKLAIIELVKWSYAQTENPTEQE